MNPQRLLGKNYFSSFHSQEINTKRQYDLLKFTLIINSPSRLLPHLSGLPVLPTEANLNKHKEAVRSVENGGKALHTFPFSHIYNRKRYFHCETSSHKSAMFSLAQCEWGGLESHRKEKIPKTSDDTCVFCKSPPRDSDTLGSQPQAQSH